MFSCYCAYNITTIKEHFKRMVKHYRTIKIFTVKKQTETITVLDGPCCSHNKTYVVAFAPLVTAQSHSREDGRKVTEMETNLFHVRIKF